MTVFRYAIEPNVLLNQERLQMLLLSLGVEHGRVMVNYPKKWRAHLFEQARQVLSETELVRFGALMQALVTDGSKCINSGLSYDPETPWRENASAIAPALRAVVVENDCHEREEFECVSDIWMETSRWSVRRDGHFRRDAQGLAEFIAPFANLGKSLYLFDVHFSPTSNAFREGLTAILGALERQPRLLEIHSAYRYPQPPPHEEQVWNQQCQELLPSCIPAGWKATIVRWRRRPSGGPRPHQRFVANERGGIDLDYGFQVAGPDDRSAYQLLTRAAAADLVAEISGRSKTDGDDRPYELVSETTVSGVLD